MSGSRRRKILTILGTRPEAIKLCPVILELRRSRTLETAVCATGQHREMLRQALAAFGVQPDTDLDLMRPGQPLDELVGSMLAALGAQLRHICPDIVLVQGDTATTLAGALAAFYAGIPVAHVEAGLRTGDLRNPLPEEYHRCAVDLLSALHFAPTEEARENLLREGRPAAGITVTGNTGIDALRLTVDPHYRHPCLDWAEGSRLIVVTAHRRENLGEPIRAVFRGLRRAVEEFPDVKAVCPVHGNPAVQAAAAEVFRGCERVRLEPPLDVRAFHNLLHRCFFIVTDSGGIQEEAPSLGKPVLVTRRTTERAEGLRAGTLQLVGTGESEVYEACRRLLTDPGAYGRMSQIANPYGDGHASERIRAVLEAL